MISTGLRQEFKSYNLRTTIISPGAVDMELPSSVGDPDTAEGIKIFMMIWLTPCKSGCKGIDLAERFGNFNIW